MVGVVILAGGALVSGCGSMPGGTHRITVDSAPSGATVYGAGVELGTTPVAIEPNEVFPARMVGLSYRADGVLKLERAGCKTHTQRVDDAVIAKDIFVKLECQPGAATSEAPPRNQQAPAARAVTPPPPAAPETRTQNQPKKPASGGDVYAERLRRIENLRKQGLISEAEYQELRRKILSEL